MSEPRTPPPLRLLSLDERDVEWRLHLAQVTHELVGAVIAHHSRHQRALYYRLTNPQPGDYVYEVSFVLAQEEPQRYTGFLLRVVEEPYEEHDDLPPPTRDVWYVQYGPNDDDVVRWENCSFRTIPVDRRAFAAEVEAIADAYRERVTKGSSLDSDPVDSAR